MESILTGWVVINIKHPVSGKKFMVESTFATTRKKAIEKFIHGSNESWVYWKRKYNYRVVRADMTVSVNTGFYPEYFDRPEDFNY